ncbi:hypothetical protein ACX12E_26345 [Paenibacillus vandeheii]
MTNRFQTGMVEFTIRYIGDENMVKDVGYQFGGKDLTASGLEENLDTAVRDIKHASGPKYLENEDFPSLSIFNGMKIRKRLYIFKSCRTMS